MIETYAFLAMFTIQIVAGSVVCPELFIRRVRADSASFPDERFAELFPGVDKDTSTGRFVTRYRARNTAIAMLGLPLLSWFFIQMRRPGWNEVSVLLLMTVYLFAQMAPHILIARGAEKFNKRLRTALAETKRKAVLQRRGLFDFISPLTMCLAGLSYLLFAVLVIYARRHPFPGFAALGYIVVITLTYVFFAFVVFASLHSKRRNPLATHADRLYGIGMLVKTLVYTCIGCTVFMALNLMLGLLHLASWRLFEISGFFVIAVIQPYVASAIARRRRNRDAPSPGAPLPSNTGNQSA